MNIERMTTALKQMFEAKPVFKPAGKGQLAARAVQREKALKNFKIVYKAGVVIRAASQEEAQEIFEELDLEARHPYDYHRPTPGAKNPLIDFVFYDVEDAYEEPDREEQD